MIFGATGMVGKGVLRECLLASDVERVLAVGRTASGVTHAKLRDLRVADLTDYRAVEADLSGYDACFFCLGVSSVGMSEAQYTRITYDLTVAAAEVWARVKGRTENALRRLPFKAAYMFRPSAIQSMHGERPKARGSAVAYTLGGWLLPLLRAMFPRTILTTESIGKAMLAVARRGAPQVVLEPGDIYDAARGA